MSIDIIDFLFYTLGFWLLYCKALSFKGSCSTDPPSMKFPFWWGTAILNVIFIEINKEKEFIENTPDFYF